MERRKLLKIFGVSSAGAITAGALRKSVQTVKTSGDNAKDEIEKLKKAYQELDGRSRLLIRLVLMMCGVDFVLAI